MMANEVVGETGSLLKVFGLKVVFPTNDGLVKAVDTMDLTIREGEKLGLIGESGCGKTVFGHAIMRILEEDAKVSGEIMFRGRRLYSLDMESMRRIRGREIVLKYLIMTRVSAGGGNLSVRVPSFNVFILVLRARADFRGLVTAYTCFCIM